MNRVENIKVLCCTLNKTFLPLLWFLRTEYNLKLLAGHASCPSVCLWLDFLQRLDHGESEVKVKAAQACPTLCDPMDQTVHGILRARILGRLPLLQGIFPTQGSNPGLPHCRQILYQLSHKGSPRILEWVAYSFASGSSQPRNRTGISCIASRFFTNWAIREAPGHAPVAN